VTIKPAETLIVFDEIQECPKALTSLKYFCENASQYHIAAGSFLGVAIHEGTGFPVGKVNLMTLYPLTFYEFLDALKE
jgi:predicted AAA+ superfamily ATPase